MAIANVNKRLQLYYKQNETNQINITSEENKGTSFTFEVPIDRDRFDFTES